MVQVMLDVTIVENLKKRYNQIHPLAFHRSVERAESVGELFDMLDTFPTKYPVVWDEESRRWVHTKDATLSERFDFKGVVKKRRRKK